MLGALKTAARVTGKCTGGALLGCAFILGAVAGVLLALAGTINESTDR